jgi:hypothetical protein
MMASSKEILFFGNELASRTTSKAGMWGKAIMCGC